MERYNAAPGRLECYNFGAKRVQVFQPTMEEFIDFENLVQYMEDNGAHRAGIAKVIPPNEWKPRANGYVELESLKITSPVEQLFLGSCGSFQMCNVVRPELLLKEYITMANSKHFAPPNVGSFDDLERNYWRNLYCFHPIYGADIPGSLFDTTQNVWNIANLPSILKLVLEEQNVHIHGVNTPYLYFGMWKTTFPWHTEDADLYSINYLHFGAPKFWYVVPPSSGLRFERVAESYFPTLYKQCHAFLRHKTTVLSPTFLHDYSIPYNKVLQFPGEFIITFPYSYHSGFNTGFNCAESTNFALPRWIDYGKYCSKCNCMHDTVKIDMDCFVRRFQPDRYEAWHSGNEKAVHPEKTTAGQVFNISPTAVRKSLPRSRPSSRASSYLSDSSAKKSKITFNCQVDCLSNKVALADNISNNQQMSLSASYSQGQNVQSLNNQEITKREELSSTSHLPVNLTAHNKFEKSALNIGLVFSEQSPMTNVSSLTLKLIPVPPCSCGRCSSLRLGKCLNEEELSHWQLQDGETLGPMGAILSPLFIWHPFSFYPELAFNHFMSRRSPHCAICQFFVPDSPVINGPCPVRSVPLPSKSYSRDSNLPTESVLLNCQICLLTVHAFCYGAEEPSSDDVTSWLCDRCRSGNLSAHCSLCVMRGGALKPTKSGNWSHIVCELFVDATLFDSNNIGRIRIRNPISETLHQEIKEEKTPCKICLRCDGSLARCTAEDFCHNKFHVTCGAYFGMLFLSNPFYIICFHSNRRDLILNVCNAPSPEIGDPVVFIKDNSFNFSAAHRLQPGIVTDRMETTRLQVRIKDCSATVIHEFAYKLTLDNGLVVDTTRGHIVPFFLKHYDPLYLCKN